MSSCEASYAAWGRSRGPRKLPAGHVRPRRDFGVGSSFVTVEDHDRAGEEVSVCHC